jgi:sulfate adenylyltransferase subunit 1 (EFTu-like GTPase family)
MGILRGWGILIGILPIPRPEHIEQTYARRTGDIAYSYMDNIPEIDKETRNFLDLSSLNGSNVSVNDIRKGNYKGTLLYNIFDNKYSLKTSDGIIGFKVRDLEKVTG